jgi:hypothetical protein
MASPLAVSRRAELGGDRKVADQSVEHEQAGACARVFDP